MNASATALRLSISPDARESPDEATRSETERAPHIAITATPEIKRAIMASMKANPPSLARDDIRIVSLAAFLPVTAERDDLEG